MRGASDRANDANAGACIVRDAGSSCARPGATTTTVLGNVKVAMLFLFSRVLFGETKDWSWQMLGGALVALVGFALYSGAKLRAMRKAKLAAVK